MARAAERAGYSLGFAAARIPALPAALERFAVPRAGIYAPDQLPGFFAWTAATGPPWLSRARILLAVAADALIAAAFAARGRRYA